MVMEREFGEDGFGVFDSTNKFGFLLGSSS
jgi:hypothetical protein